MSNADSVESTSKKSNYTFASAKSNEPSSSIYRGDYDEDARGADPVDGNKIPEVVSLVSSDEEDQGSSSSPVAYDETSNSNSNSNTNNPTSTSNLGNNNSNNIATTSSGTNGNNKFESDGLPHSTNGEFMDK